MFRHLTWLPRGELQDINSEKQFVLTGQRKAAFPKGIPVFRKGLLLSITTFLWCLNFTPSCSQDKWNFSPGGPSHRDISPPCATKQRGVERQSSHSLISNASMSDPLAVLLMGTSPCYPPHPTDTSSQKLSILGTRCRVPGQSITSLWQDNELMPGTDTNVYSSRIVPPKGPVHSLGQWWMALQTDLLPQVCLCMDFVVSSQRLGKGHLAFFFNRSSICFLHPTWI